MIALASDCLLFQTAGGESIPYSVEMLSLEMMGESAKLFDQEFLTHAAKAVFHYFKYDVGRKTVSMGEFAGALEKVLRAFALTAKAASQKAAPRVLESDLFQLARQSGEGCELFFFPLLREELRQQLRQGPRVVLFRGLRGAVKRLVGAQRWGLRCHKLEEQIVTYLRECLGAESHRECALVVE